jgi:hypothetical protein
MGLQATIAKNLLKKFNRDLEYAYSAKGFTCVNMYYIM